MMTAKKRALKLFSPALTVFFVLSVCFNLSVQAQTASEVEDLVKTLSGGKLQFESKAVPDKLVADFNGDKIEDVAVIVNLSDTVKNVGKSVKIQYPYPFKKEVDTNDLALFIIHGRGKGWQFAQKSSVLFLGRNSALIFQRDRLGETGDGMELDIDKRGRAGIYFVTEGAEGTIKWNGKKYTWTESH